MTEPLTNAELDALKSTAIGRMCLRRFQEYEVKIQQHDLHDCATENEHELRQLRAENARLRAALEQWVCRSHREGVTGTHQAGNVDCDLARAALASGRGDA